MHAFAWWHFHIGCCKRCNPGQAMQWHDHVANQISEISNSHRFSLALSMQCWYSCSVAATKSATVLTCVDIWCVCVLRAHFEPVLVPMLVTSTVITRIRASTTTTTVFVAWNEDWTSKTKPATVCKWCVHTHRQAAWPRLVPTMCPWCTKYSHGTTLRVPP